MNKHTNFDEEIEKYPRTNGSTIISVILAALLAAFIIIQYIFGADRFIYWVAGLIS